MVIAQKWYQALYADCKPHIRHGRNGLPAVWMMGIDIAPAQTDGRKRGRGMQSSSLFARARTNALVVSASLVGMCVLVFARNEVFVRFGMGKLERASLATVAMLRSL